MGDAPGDGHVHVILVHGFGCAPSKFWYPRLIRELTELGNVSTAVPYMPGGRSPQVDDWLDRLRSQLSQVDPAHSIVLIGHSVGCNALLRLFAQSEAELQQPTQQPIPHPMHAQLADETDGAIDACNTCDTRNESGSCNACAVASAPTRAERPSRALPALRRVRGVLCVAGWFSVDEPWEGILPWCTPIDTAAARRAFEAHGTALVLLVSDNDRYNADAKGIAATWRAELGARATVLVAKGHFSSKQQPEVFAAARKLVEAARRGGERRPVAAAGAERAASTEAAALTAEAALLAEADTAAGTVATTAGRMASAESAGQAAEVSPEAAAETRGIGTVAKEQAGGEAVRAAAETLRLVEDRAEKFEEKAEGMLRRAGSPGVAKWAGQRHADTAGQRRAEGVLERRRRGESQVRAECSIDEAEQSVAGRRVAEKAVVDGEGESVQIDTTTATNEASVAASAALPDEPRLRAASASMHTLPTDTLVLLLHTLLVDITAGAAAVMRLAMCCTAWRDAVLRSDAAAQLYAQRARQLGGTSLAPSASSNATVGTGTCVGHLQHIPARVSTCLEQLVVLETVSNLGGASLYFDRAAATLRPGSTRARLEQLIAMLHRHRRLQVSVHGHAGAAAPTGALDELAEPRFSLAAVVSLHRAKAAANLLAEAGINRCRISLLAWGDLVGSAAGWARGGHETRRVELSFSLDGVQLPALGAHYQNLKPLHGPLKGTVDMARLFGFGVIEP